MRKPFLLLAVTIAAAAGAHAHFVFVVPQSGTSTARVFMSETLQPDSAVPFGVVSGAMLSIRDAAGHDSPLNMTKTAGAYTVDYPSQNSRMIHGLVDLGIQQMGSAKQPYILQYHPKTILGTAFGDSMLGETVPVELSPVGKPEAFQLQLIAQGKPLANSEITVILPDSSQKKLKTDSAGKTDVLTQPGRYGAWARYWELTPGERDGKPYAEVRHYATLVFDSAAQPAPNGQIAAGTTSTFFATMPQPAASFGAVVSDGFLYLYGGHIAPTHSYSTKAVSGKFARLNLIDPKKWEQLPEGPAMQGMNLAADRGKVYRIGGMTPRNKPGEKEATYSVDNCARFDPVTKNWEPLPPLPEPRSSHDVVVVNGKLIVVGGWTLDGSQKPAWRNTLAQLDLNAATPAWKEVQQPFKRRALIASALDGYMYVLGGMDDHGKIVHDVSIYDPATGAWTAGPNLPGEEINGFAPAACVHRGRLWLSTGDGSLYYLDSTKHGWEKAGTATPRVAHRIVGNRQRILIIGGAAKGRNSDLIEAFTTKDGVEGGSAERED